MSVSTLAGYDGTCPECGGRIRAGVDQIGLIDMTGRVWAHLTCPDSPDDAADTQAIGNGGVPRTVWERAVW